MTIESVTTEHIPILIPLFDDYMQFYGKESNPDQYADFLYNRISSKEAFIYVAVDPLGVGMGFALLYPSYSSVSQGRIFVLNDLYVNENYRRSRVASRLLRHCVSWAKKQGAIRLHLETEKSNSAAQAVYEKEGWTQDEEHYCYSIAL